jgi:hypothetical protein
MFVYLFFVWGAVIILLYCIARAHDKNSSGHEPGNGN